jgi:hypothetical protein
LRRLEPDDGKLSCPVLRGRRDGNIPPLPDKIACLSSFRPEWLLLAAGGDNKQGTSVELHAIARCSCAGQLPSDSQHLTPPAPLLHLLRSVPAPEQTGVAVRDLPFRMPSGVGATPAHYQRRWWAAAAGIWLASCPGSPSKQRSSYSEQPPSGTVRDGISPRSLFASELWAPGRVFGRPNTGDYEEPPETLASSGFSSG